MVPQGGACSFVYLIERSEGSVEGGLCDVGVGDVDGDGVGLALAPRSGEHGREVAGLAQVQL